MAKINKITLNQKSKNGTSRVIKINIKSAEPAGQSLALKKPNQKVSDILRKVGVKVPIIVSSVDTKSTDTKITALLKDFGKAVRSESKEIKKASTRKRRASLNNAKTATTVKLHA